MSLTNGLVEGITLKPIALLIAILSLFLSSLASASLLNIAPESVEAEAWLILDAESEQVIAAHQENVQRAPASLTKMMVAYIALKEVQAGRLDLNQQLTATPVVKNVMWDESQMYLKEGDQITIDHLLAGLIVMSANDAALTLAEKISGNVPAFIERMNQEAQALGMQHTHFQNPAGITMPEHYSTAADLAKLALALTQETPHYLFYSKQQSFTYNQHYHRATNILLKTDPTVDGLKTGFTRAAGYNLALTAQRPTASEHLENRRLIVVVLGAKNATQRAEIAHRLMELAYTFTRNEVMLKEQQPLADIPVIQSTLKFFKLQNESSRVMTTSLYQNDNLIHLNQFDVLNKQIILDLGSGISQVIVPKTETQTRINIDLHHTSLTAPLAKIMSLATIQVYQNDQLLQSFDIESDVQLEQASWFERLLLVIKSWLPFLFSPETVEAKIYTLNS